MDKETNAIFTHIKKPDDFKTWTAEQQRTWLDEHFNEWFKSLSTEEVAQIKTAVAPLVKKEMDKRMGDLVTVLRDMITLEKMADLSGVIKFTAPQKEKLKH